MHPSSSPVTGEPPRVRRGACGPSGALVVRAPIVLANLPKRSQPLSDLLARGQGGGVERRNGRAFAASGLSGSSCGATLPDELIISARLARGALGSLV